MIVKKYKLLVILAPLFGFVAADGDHHVQHQNPKEHQHHSHIQASPSYSSSSYISGKCSPNYNAYEVERSIRDIDAQLQEILSYLPPAIIKARSDIQSNNAQSNRDQTLVGVFNFIGALSGSLGILYNKDPLALSSGDQLALIAENFWGYGYWGPYLLELEDTDPGCGVAEFNRVVGEYSFVTNLAQVYSIGNVYANTPDDRPELRKYYLGEFGRKLKLSLHCIVSKGDSVASARRVVGLIDKYINLATTRLDLTKNLL